MQFDPLAAGKSVADREDDGTTIKVRDELGELMLQDDGTSPVTITVAGSYSTRYRKLIEATGDKNWKKTRLEAEDARRNTLEVVAGCILAWDGFTTNGQPFPLNKPNACGLLDACPWIREQVEKAMHDHALFSTPVSPS